jgi:putative aldouronate transport system substrate-binding protein
LKKWSVLLVALVFAVVTVLSGCSSDSGQGGDSGDAKGKTAITPPGQLPIVNEKVTLKVLVRGNSSVEDFATNEFTKWLEEKTNIHIDWEVAPEKSATEKLNLVLSSGEYPDVIMGFGVSPTQMMIFGTQGVFLPLNKLIEEYGVETKRMFQETPSAKDLITAPDGNIYALPQVNECYHCFLSQRMWIYKPWLDKLGLAMPTTTEEFREVLKAFKTKDPNGNGKADEIPMAGNPINFRDGVDSFLMNSFIYNPADKRLLLNNGKVDVSFNKPEFKEGLKYLRSLYAEGLISPLSFTQDANQLKQMGESEVPILGASSGHNMGTLATLNGKSGRWLEYVAVPPLKGPKGVRLAAYNPYAVSNGQYVITKSAKHPEAAFRLADYMYNQEVTLRSIHGRIGQEVRMAEKNEIGINGKPALWKQLVGWGQIQNVHWSQTGPSYRTSDFRLGEVASPDQPLEPTLYKETKEKMEPYKVSLDQVLPPLFFTSDQASELADLDKVINDHVKEMIARFVTGDVDLDKGWDGYIKNLENMNLKRYLDIYQQAYDAKFKKK